MTPTETRELLALAAKAAGIRGMEWSDFDDRFEYSVEHKGGTNYFEWNPLTDHGDRYRLARVCEMAIDFDVGQVLFPLGMKWIDLTFTPGNDKEEALAIVRAAAEIGRNMP